jgi:hypothetical protein
MAQRRIGANYRLEAGFNAGGFSAALPDQRFCAARQRGVAVQGTDTECDVVRYGEALMPGFFGLKNNVAALLMNDTISPIAA